MRRSSAGAFLIRFDDVEGEGKSVHEIRNFGEALFSIFREDNWASVDIAEVDACTDRFHVTLLRAGKMQRVRQMIEDAAYQDMMRRFAIEFIEPEF